MPTSALSDDQTIVGSLLPSTTAVAVGTSYAFSTWIDMKLFKRLQFLGIVGTPSAGGTSQFTVYQATSSTGTSAKPLASTVQSASRTGAGIDALNIRGSDLDSNNAFEFVNLQMVVGVATSPISVIGLGDPNLTPPAPLTGNTVVQHNP